MRKKGIVRKTFLFASILIVLTTTLSFAVLYFVMPGYYLHQKHQSLERSLETLTGQLQTAATTENCAAILSDFCLAHNVSVLSFDAKGEPLPELSSPIVTSPLVSYFFREEAGEIDEGGVQFSQKAKEDAPSSFFIIRGEEDDGAGKTVVSFGLFNERQKSQMISLRGKLTAGPIRTVEINSPLQPIDEAQGVMLTLIPYVLLIGLALSLVFAWVYARQISRPILKISDAAVRMQRLESDVTSGVDTDDEIGLLSRNLDALYVHLRENIGDLRDEMDKVGRLERAKTDMMRSAGHELKTPIAALSGMLDGMIDDVGAYRDKEKYLPVCKEQVEKLSALAYEILDASRDDAPEGADEPTDVSALLRRVLEDCAVSLRERRLRVVQEIGPVSLSTNPTRLYRVLSNLIRNAACYTPPGGQVNILLDETQCVVENDCDPIPEEEIPKLFEPFYTGSFSRDRANSGTGLGLYIVKQNLERLRIPYEAACPGGRFVFRLALGG